jgi:hypothetical protein
MKRYEIKSVLINVTSSLEAFLYENEPLVMPSGNDATEAKSVSALLGITNKGAERLLERKYGLRFVRTAAGSRRFRAPVGSPIGESAEDLSRAMVSTFKPNGGFTFNTHKGRLMHKGCAVSPYPEWTQATPLKDFDINHIRDFYDAHQELLAEPNHYIGAWRSKGNVVLDVTIVVHDPNEADKISEENDQQAWYDLSTGQEHVVNRHATSGGVLGSKSGEPKTTKVLIDMSTATNEDLAAVVTQLKGE